MGKPIPPEPPEIPEHSVLVEEIQNCNCGPGIMQWPSDPNILYNHFVLYSETSLTWKYQDSSGDWAVMLTIAKSSGHFCVQIRIPPFPQYGQQQCFVSEAWPAPSPILNTYTKDTCCNWPQSGYGGRAYVNWTL